METAASWPGCQAEAQPRLTLMAFSHHAKQLRYKPRV